MTEKETLQTESQSISENNKPWYKKKNTIITASSVLGLGAITTIIAVPIALTTTSTPTAPVVDPVQDAISTLNAKGNKTARIGIWNQYMGTLTTTTRAVAPLDTIVRSPEFITEFISFLTSNLYESDATPIIAGSVTKADLAKIVAEISSTASQEIFKNTTGLATYTSLFSFQGTSSMFTFKNLATNATTEFSLHMPSAGLDLIYNTDETVSIKIMPYDTATTANNVRLSINTFADPAITSSSPKDIYFKADTIIKLPSAVMTNFKTYLKTTADKEVVDRGVIEKSLTSIKDNIEKDTTNAKGLSYWNSFAINYATSNIAFLKEDFKKEVVDSGMYKFLAANAKKADGTLITSTELAALKTQLIVDATNGLNTNPFVSSPISSDLLFNTSNTSDSKYSLSLNITKFSYDFVVNNLFVGPTAIVITPKLELSGSLSITPTSGTATTFTITNGAYDISSLVSMGYATEFATGGLTGFFTQLIDPKSNQLAKLTNSLATLNSKPITEQITFWNTFAKDTTKNGLILAELKKTDVLANFILNNIDITNLFGYKVTDGTLPTIDAATLKTSINTAAANLTTADLSFANPGVAAITLTGSNNAGIAYGTTDTTNDKFETITIYFGYEANSISNFNVTSKLETGLTTGTSNVSLSQTIDSTATTFTDKAAVEAAAKKRISIVFDKTTTGGTAKASTSIAYFGQTKNNASPAVQVTKPIIISSSILTNATTFIESINFVK